MIFASYPPSCRDSISTRQAACLRTGAVGGAARCNPVPELAQHWHGADCLQLTLRFSFRQRLMPSVRQRLPFYVRPYGNVLFDHHWLRVDQKCSKLKTGGSRDHSQVSGSFRRPRRFSLIWILVRVLRCLVGGLGHRDFRGRAFDALPRPPPFAETFHHNIEDRDEGYRQ